MNPANTVYDAKRLIGRRFNDPSVQADMKHFSFKVIDRDSKPMIQVEYKHEEKVFSPEEISSMILLKMKVRTCACADRCGPVPRHTQRSLVFTVRLCKLDHSLSAPFCTRARLAHGFNTPTRPFLSDASPPLSPHLRTFCRRPLRRTSATPSPTPW